MRYSRAVIKDEIKADENPPEWMFEDLAIEIESDEEQPLELLELEYLQDSDLVVISNCLEEDEINEDGDAETEEWTDTDSDDSDGRE